MSFYVSAIADIISETKLSDSDLIDLNNILRDLPHVNQRRDYKKTIYTTFN